MAEQYLNRDAVLKVLSDKLYKYHRVLKYTNPEETPESFYELKRKISALQSIQHEITSLSAYQIPDEALTMDTYYSERTSGDEIKDSTLDAASHMFTNSVFLDERLADYGSKFELNDLCLIEDTLGYKHQFEESIAEQIHRLKLYQNDLACPIKKDYWASQSASNDSTSLNNDELTKLNKHGDGTFSIEDMPLNDVSDSLRDFLGHNTNTWYLSDWDVLRDAHSFLNTETEFDYLDELKQFVINNQVGVDKLKSDKDVITAARQLLNKVN